MADPEAQGGEPREGGRKAASKPNSRLSLFLRSSVFDFLLVLVASVGLVFTVSYGFNSAPDLRGNVALEAVLCAVLLVVLYLGGWSKRMLPVSAIAYVVLGVGVVGALAAASPEAVPMFQDGQLNDVEANYAVFGFVVVVVPVLVYLLSRRTWGVAVLLFASALACGFIQFLYRDWVTDQPGTIAALVVLVAVGALFVVQGYRQGILASRSVGRTSFGATFAFGLVASIACVAIGVGLFYAVVSALGLETANLKPFEDYYQREVIEYEGGYDQQQVIDPDLGSSNLSDEENETRQNAEGEQGEEEDNESGGGFALVQLIQDTLNLDDWSATFDAVRYDVPPGLWALLALLVVALIVGIILFRRYLRKRWLQKLGERPLCEQAICLYGFFTSRFKRLKIDRPAFLTPLEFALVSQGELAGFTRNASHTDFLAVTLMYQRAAYGAGDVTEEGCRAMKDYYEAFFKNARARMSWLKWAFWGFWRI